MRARDLGRVLGAGGLLVGFALLAGCARGPATRGEHSNPGAAPPQPPLAAVTRVVRAATGEEIPLARLIEEVAGADALLVGETHLDEVTHRTELALLEGWIDARRGRVLLAMEMFSRADQSAIDRYLAGEIDEAAFLAAADEWPNYHTDYRPLVESARAAGIPVIGANLSPSLRRSLARGGAEAFRALSDAERSGVARELFPNSPLYWERFDRTLRGHMGGPGAADPESRLHSIQSLWDNTMGESCALALDAHPGHGVLLVVGGFHTWGGLGTAEQLRRRAPDARVATVQIVAVDDLAGIEPEPGDESADYVIFAEARARSLSEGTRAVAVRSELRYRLSLPDGPGPWPLLIWCPDEGANAADEAERWGLLLGVDAAVAVLEHPYPAIEEDLRPSGRYTWEETFFEDLARCGGGIARVRETVSRSFPVDPARVLLAGAGEGARIAAAARWQERDGPATLALDPGPVGRLAEGGLADPEPPEGGRLVVRAAPADLESWSAEVAARAAVGFPGAVTELEPGDDGALAVRELLGLAPRPQVAPRTLWISHGSATARQWASLAAAELGGEWRIEVIGDVLPDDPRDGSLWLETDLETTADPLVDRPLPPIAPRFAAADLSSGRGIPLPPGPFGGTVVLVLPPGVDDARRAAWRKLEEDDVTRRRSRFVGIRIAESGTARDLPARLDELRGEGKSVILIAPLRFCATAHEMRELRASIAGHDEGLRISWSPGLGGELWRALASGTHSTP